MEIPSKAAKTKGLKGILYFKTVKDGIIYGNILSFFRNDYYSYFLINFY